MKVVDEARRKERERENKRKREGGKGKKEQRENWQWEKESGRKSKRKDASVDPENNCVYENSSLNHLLYPGHYDWRVNSKPSVTPVTT